MTEDEFEEFVDSQLEEGWRPENLEGTGCSCHIHPPCSYCCIEKCDEIKEEIMEEFNINIKGTGEGETMEERYSIQHFKSEFSSAFSDPEFEDGLNQLIAHERQRALQEQREEIASEIEKIKKDVICGCNSSQNCFHGMYDAKIKLIYDIIKAIKNLK